jgi:hypothetical protein
MNHGRHAAPARTTSRARTRRDSEPPCARHRTKDPRPRTSSPWGGENVRAVLAWATAFGTWEGP